MEVYLDNSATTRAYEAVGERVKEILCQSYGNPSSLHRKGLEAEQIVKEAREVFGKLLRVEPKEIYFTSGGTEGDNLAILGAARANKRRGTHIISSQIEHSAVLESLRLLEEEGFEVTYLSVNEEGKVSLEELRESLREDTILVSLMEVNNEVGSILPMEEAGKIIRAFSPEILFHVDGVQGFGKLPCRIKESYVDLYTISGHKIHGPKGVGVLYIKNKTKITPLMFGGGQQKDLRPGTENVPGIGGIALAAQLLHQDRENKIERMYELKSRFYQGLEKLEGVKINGGLGEGFAPHICSVGFEGVRSEVLLHALEEKGISVSSGSACASNHPSISRVLKGMGVESKYLESTLRFSFSEFTTAKEIDYTLENLYNIVPMLRKYRRR